MRMRTILVSGSIQMSPFSKLSSLPNNNTIIVGYTQGVVIHVGSTCYRNLIYTIFIFSWNKVLHGQNVCYCGITAPYSSSVSIPTSSYKINRQQTDHSAICLQGYYIGLCSMIKFYMILSLPALSSLVICDLCKQGRVLKKLYRSILVGRLTEISQNIENTEPTLLLNTWE